MLYFDHGLSQTFTHYDQYFGPNCEDDAYVYLALANSVIHSVRSDALTIAEDVSGMPGLAAPATSGGVGFDYRLSMGTPDYWIKLIKEVPDEQWHMSALFHELTNRRCEEKTISYVESHDQALVGDQTIIFRLIGAAMYDHMGVSQQDLIVDRGIALHKMIRLVTLATAGHGWLNFMGNEFGHPEWIDFPREGNGWSYHYARRQWHLADDPALRYHFLGSFGRAMMDLCRRKRFLATPGPRLLCEHVADQVLAFERAGLVFAFNFSPARSFSDYALSAPAGTYRVALDSDAVEFGGFGRVAAGLDYPTRREGPGVHKLLVYLPARSGVVFEKVD
jgi:1,4-alpha-glucan branching enzyme